MFSGCLLSLVSHFIHTPVLCCRLYYSPSHQGSICSILLHLFSLFTRRAILRRARGSDADSRLWLLGLIAVVSSYIGEQKNILVDIKFSSSPLSSHRRRLSYLLVCCCRSSSSSLSCRRLRQLLRCRLCRSLQRHRCLCRYVAVSLGLLCRSIISAFVAMSPSLVVLIVTRRLVPRRSSQRCCCLCPHYFFVARRLDRLSTSSSFVAMSPSLHRRCLRIAASSSLVVFKSRVAITSVVSLVGVDVVVASVVVVVVVIVVVVETTTMYDLTPLSYVYSNVV